jgi:archaellum component FlaC
MTRLCDFAKLRVASWLFPILLLCTAPALACNDGEYSVSSYTMGEKYEVDMSAAKFIKKEGKTPPLKGDCVDCNDRGPYAERKRDLDEKKKKLRELRKYAQDQGKATLQKEFNDARDAYNKKNTELRTLDEELRKAESDLQKAGDSQKTELKAKKEALERKKQDVVNELKTVKKAWDGARDKLQKHKAVIEQIKKEIASLEGQTSQLNQARNSCRTPCISDEAGQCR